MKNSVKLGMAALLAFGVSSCKNSDVDFPDYEGGITAYFAYQYPVRTITLGTDPEQDNSLDNQHKCRITATHGGSYDSRNLSIDIVVDPSLVDNLSLIHI